jgi:hypothetical protein
MRLLTSERANELLSYDKTTGDITWRIGRRRTKAGELAGNSMPNGRVRICVDQHDYYAYRLAWLLETGSWPKFEIDHKDGDVTNNRFSNLRDAPRATNSQNRRKALITNKSTGVLGVSKKRNKFEARIRPPGCGYIHLGTFESVDEAHAAYLDAKRKLHEGNTL